MGAAEGHAAASPVEAMELLLSRLSKTRTNAGVPGVDVQREAGLKVGITLGLKARRLSACTIDWSASDGMLLCATAGSAGPAGRSSEVGYGMWGMGGWTGSDDDESLRVAATAPSSWAATSSTPPGPTATGTARRLLGEALRGVPGTAPYVATKIPPKNVPWPAQADYALDDVFPADHIREYTEKSLANLGVPAIDLLQFHVWTTRGPTTSAGSGPSTT